MFLNQTFTLTPDLQHLFNTLEGLKTAFSHIPIKPETILNLRRHSLLNSALYSARIEGITKNSDVNKLAIQNLESTYAWLYRQPPNQKVTLELLQTLHARSQKNLDSSAGHFRTEQSAIFNSAGVAVYLTPPPQEIKRLIDSWLEEIKTSEFHPVFQAIISHYQFEKIHPFLDGNGRVGRLVFTQLLRLSGYDFSGLLELGEGVSATRDEYYFHLQNESKDLTSFIKYFLTLLNSQATKVLSQITEPQEPQIEPSLMPRRQELLSIIRDHSPVSFDFLHRRFMAIPASTLRYDLLHLQKAGLIHKLGVTNRVQYAINESA